MSAPLPGVDPPAANLPAAALGHAGMGPAGLIPAGMGHPGPPAPPAPVVDPSQQAQHERKQEAIHCLNRAVAQVQQVDGRRRFVMVGDASTGDQKLFTRSAFYAALHPDRAARANEELSNNLWPLLQEPLDNEEDKACRRAVFGKINRGEANAKDIRLLHHVIKRHQRGQEAKTEAAYVQLHHFAAKAFAAGSNKSVTLSDGDVDVRFKNKRYMTKSGRLEAGQYIKSELQPLRTVVAERGTYEDLEFFDRCMRRAASGGLKSTHVLTLERLMTRLYKPQLYARQTLDRLSAMAKSAGHRGSLTFRDRLGDYKVCNRLYMTKSGRLQAGQKLAEDLRGLRPLFGRASHSQKREFNALLGKVSMGDARSLDIIQMQDLIKQIEDPVGFAREELRSLCNKDSKTKYDTIRWDNDKMEVMVGRPRYYDASARATALMRLSMRLSGLEELFPDNGDELNRVARGLLRRIGRGTFTSEDAVHLQRLVEIRTELSSRHDHVARGPLNRAMRYLEGLQAFPESGEGVRVKLLALQELFRNNPDHTMDELQPLLRRIARSRNSEQARGHIRQLASKVRDVRRDSVAAARRAAPNPLAPRNVLNIQNVQNQQAQLVPDDQRGGGGMEFAARQPMQRLRRVANNVQFNNQQQPVGPESDQNLLDNDSERSSNLQGHRSQARPSIPSAPQPGGGRKAPGAASAHSRSSILSNNSVPNSAQGMLQVPPQGGSPERKSSFAKNLKNDGAAEDIVLDEIHDHMRTRGGSESSNLSGQQSFVQGHPIGERSGTVHSLDRMASGPLPQQPRVPSHQSIPNAPNGGNEVHSEDDSLGNIETIDVPSDDMNDPVSTAAQPDASRIGRNDELYDQGGGSIDDNELSQTIQIQVNSNENDANVNNPVDPNNINNGINVVSGDNASDKLEDA